MIVGVVLAHLLVPMKLLIPLVVSGVTLLTVNLMALYLFSPGKYYHTDSCNGDMYVAHVIRLAA